MRCINVYDHGCWHAHLAEVAVLAVSIPLCPRLRPWVEAVIALEIHCPRKTSSCYPTVDGRVQLISIGTNGIEDANPISIHRRRRALP